MRSLPVILSIWCTALSAGAADRYLDGNATGANDGTSWADAWQAEGHINWGLLASNDTLWVRGGQTYADSNGDGELLLGEDTAGVSIKIDPSATEPAVFPLLLEAHNMDFGLIDGWLNGTQMFVATRSASVLTNSAASCMSIKQCSGTTFRGIRADRTPFRYIDGSPGEDTVSVHGFRVEDPDDLTFERCHVSYVTADGWNIPSPPASPAYDVVTIAHCSVLGVSDDGVQCAGSLTLRDSHFDNAGVSVNPAVGGHQDGIQGGIGKSHYKIYRNVFKGFSQNIFLEETISDIQVYNNIVLNDGSESGSNRGCNISVQGYDTTPTWTGGVLLVANNLFAGYITYYATFRLTTFADAGASLTNICNNILAESRFWANVPDEGASVFFADTLVWDPVGAQYRDTDGSEVATGTDEERDRQSASSGDPLFANYSGPTFSGAMASDFMISSPASPAYNAGRDLSEFFTDDFFGRTRGLDGGWEIGPCEYAGIRAAPDDPPLRLWLGVPQ